MSFPLQGNPEFLSPTVPPEEGHKHEFKPFDPLVESLKEIIQRLERIEQTPKPSGVAMGMSKEIVERLHQIDGGASKNHCKEPYCILEEHDDQSVAHYDNLHDIVWRTPKQKERV